MRFNAIMLFVSALLAVISPEIIKAKELALVEHRIGWTGAMPVQTHTGTINAGKVNASLDEIGQLERFRIDVDMTTIRNEDIKKDKMRVKLENHLRSADFFYVEKYPVASFEMSSYDGKNMTGTMYIRGITKPLTVPASLEKLPDGSWSFAADFTFNRQDFNVNYQNSGILGTAKNKLIADDIEIKVRLALSEAIR